MIKYLFFDFRILYIEKNYALTTNKKFVSEKTNRRQIIKTNCVSVITIFK